MSKNHVPLSAKKRLLWVSSAIFFLLALLTLQFYRIQILEEEKWTHKAKKQQTFVVKEPFKRGNFFSNPYIQTNHPAKEQQFTLDVPKFHLYADSSSIKDAVKEEIAKELASLLSLDKEEYETLRGQLYKESRSRKLAPWIDEETYRSLLAWWHPFAKEHKIPKNALFFVKDYRRSYPFGKMLGQVLHTVQSSKDEKTGRAHPTGGLELHFDSVLQGKNGKRQLMRSPRNALETGDVISPPEHGSDIHLTINPVLQAIAEEEIEKGVKKAKAKCGWVGIMNPYTGEILALAQYPFFFPGDYREYFNDKELIEHTKVKAITDAHEPGSVFKPFTIAIALKANQELAMRGERELFLETEKIATSNGRFPGRSKPITDTHLHYFLNLDMAMQKSSNIYMARLVQRIIDRLGSDWYRQQIQLFGFGQKTHIELPAESAGVLPTPGKLHPNGVLEWSVPTPFSMAFGHNLQVTTLQLMRAYACLANGGILVQPTLVRKIIKGKDVLLDNTTSERINNFPRVYEKKIIDRVVKAMRYVTKPGGTAIKADVPGYTEAGKTSTPKKIVNGHYSEKLYCPRFIGFAPAVNPAFVVAIVIDEPEYGYVQGLGRVHNGGNCTGQVFREVATRSLEYLGVPHDDPYGYPPGDPRRDTSKEAWMNEARKLQELYDAWNKH